MNNIVERYRIQADQLKAARQERDALRELLKKVLNEKNLPESIREYVQKEMDESFV